MNQEQDNHLAEGIKLLVKNCNPIPPEVKKDWLNKYRWVFNPPKFGEEKK